MQVQLHLSVLLTDTLHNWGRRCWRLSQQSVGWGQKHIVDTSVTSYIFSFTHLFPICLVQLPCFAMSACLISLMSIILSLLPLPLPKYILYVHCNTALWWEMQHTVGVSTVKYTRSSSAWCQSNITPGHLVMCTVWSVLWFDVLECECSLQSSNVNKLLSED